jgi:2-polyprenyl-3-methyl-5-hydroxy-6-metoxy-1,4-benzoquinol methylase
VTSTGAGYTERLVELEQRWWKRLLPNPYAWHIRAVCAGRVLDVGCGIGRCLAYLRGRGVGVDPNATSVATARSRGFVAYTPEELDGHPELTGFDTVLCSHVLEHLERDDALALLRESLPRVRQGGRVVLICPQERGQHSDPTHVRFIDGRELRRMATEAGIVVDHVRSFPLPRPFGRWWVHNETVLVGARL